MAAQYSAEVSKARAELGIHSRWHPDDADGLRERRQTFVTARLANLLERNLADSPPLRGHQIDRLIGLLQAHPKEN